MLVDIWLLPCSLLRVKMSGFNRVSRTHTLGENEVIFFSSFLFYSITFSNVPCSWEFGYHKSKITYINKTHSILIWQWLISSLCCYAVVSWRLLILTLDQIWHWDIRQIPRGLYYYFKCFIRIQYKGRLQITSFIWFQDCITTYSDISQSKYFCQNYRSEQNDKSTI